MESNARIAIVGVTGFIGHGLPPLFSERGDSVTGVSRHPQNSMAGVDRWQTLDALDLTGHRAVINLAGDSIDKRWTQENRRNFHASRIGVTNQIVDAIAEVPPEARPKVLVNASAVGIYGDRGDEILSDTAAVGEGYLAELCREWESAAVRAENLGVRVVRMRTGIVLGHGGGAFDSLRRVFNFGIGGPLGSGRQWMPWIHLADLRRAIVHCTVSESIHGPVNGSAPNPERNEDFTRKFAAALHRPAFLRVPGFALKIALGGFGGALLEGQRALPHALNDDGFSFQFPTLEQALANLA